MKIKAIIVDDESHARSFLSKLCNRIYDDKIEIVDECSTVSSALISIKKHSPDLVFLDIQMPGETGFDLLSYFENIPFEIIFTTAHKEYALQAIKNSALDYLIKPIAVQDFKTAIGKLDFVLEKKHSLNKYQLLKENRENQLSGKQRIAFPTKIGFEVIQINEILFCKSDGSYTSIHTKEQEYYTSKSFKEICELLEFEAKFLKVHRSYLINAEHVKNFKSEDFILQMTSGDEIPVSDKKFTKNKLIDAITK
ncbi:LytR/AlgR family response regulator transcription factor [Flavobacterium procerum]|uniref:LytR/AlgR family response regulator transcription factor n=1 Tax=Flavobacterium procerum TaxID=1455569 RepID=A0ABV6BUU3_9FLAO